jgi:hypothetical protein
MLMVFQLKIVFNGILAQKREAVKVRRWKRECGMICDPGVAYAGGS